MADVEVRTQAITRASIESAKATVNATSKTADKMLKTHSKHWAYKDSRKHEVQNRNTLTETAYLTP